MDEWCRGSQLPPLSTNKTVLHALKHGGFLLTVCLFIDRATLTLSICTQPFLIFSHACRQATSGDGFWFLSASLIADFYIRAWYRHYFAVCELIQAVKRKTRKLYRLNRLLTVTRDEEVIFYLGAFKSTLPQILSSAPCREFFFKY